TPLRRGARAQRLPRDPRIPSASYVAVPVLLASLRGRSGRGCKRPCERRAISSVVAAAALVSALAAAAAAAAVMSSSSAEEPEPSSTGRGSSFNSADFGFEDLDAPVLPSDLEEALRDFDGDFRGPWEALGLDAEEPATAEELRQAYRRAVRLEHPDTSSYPDAEERFQRVRKAYAILSDDGSRALLLEAIDKEAASFKELEAASEASSSESGAGPSSAVPRWLGVSFALLGVLGFVASQGSESGSGDGWKLRSAKKPPRGGASQLREELGS
ncbi:unnamed protein product, partial [Polarella glacialis]